MLLNGIWPKHWIISVVSLKQPSFKSLGCGQEMDGVGWGYYILIIPVSIIALLSLSGGGYI